MSNNFRDQDTSSSVDTPRLERWLAVMLLAIVPMVAALLLPRGLVLHLAGIAALLFATGLVMLVVQERRR
jgi:uncharacterized membrane protein YtjA (UPF0391 family)